jgi:hypothetical protein
MHLSGIDRKAASLGDMKRRHVRAIARDARDPENRLEPDTGSSDCMQWTIDALASFPERLEACYRSIPEDFRRWTPPSWEGLAGERFTGIEHLCHVRDVEIDGYHVRFRRALGETSPTLEDLDGYVLANERNYAATRDSEALASFRAARGETLRLLSGLRDDQWDRPAIFEGDRVTVRGLVHHLCKHDHLHLAGLQWLLARIDTARSRSASRGG